MHRGTKSDVFFLHFAEQGQKTRVFDACVCFKNNFLFDEMNLKRG